MNEKNINKLVEAALAIEEQEAIEADALGYVARALIQATMPHRAQKENSFVRRNGKFSFSITAHPDIGLPYGTIPRLLLAWISTEAVRTKDRRLTLGTSLSEFMRKLDLIPSGGRWGTITRLKSQMERLFTSSISCTYTDGDQLAIKNISPISNANLWWSPKQPSQLTLVKSTLTLNEDFFNEIVNAPVPIDMRALKAIKDSAMALDLYCWLTYRMSYLNKKTTIPWAALQAQFGSNYADDKKGRYEFKRKLGKQLKKITGFYTTANIEEDKEGLILLPSNTHVKRLLKKNKGYSHNIICGQDILDQEILPNLDKGIYLYRYEDTIYSLVVHNAKVSETINLTELLSEQQATLDAIRWPENNNHQLYIETTLDDDLVNLILSTCEHTKKQG